MEAWQQEEMRRQKFDRWRQRLPRCQGCGAAIETERCLDLTVFGLVAMACENCVEENMMPTEIAR